jgi:cyanoexosortase B-associated protein
MQRFVPIVILILLVLIGAVPGYLQRQWTWEDLPRVQNIDRTANLLKTGLKVPGWKTTEQVKMTIGGNDWSWQNLEREGQKPITLILLPQKYYRNQPEVEWVDLDGFGKWQTDRHSRLNFTVSEGNKTIKVEARFFRAWDRRKTFAVVQWYALPQGGTPSPSNWFWADLFAQLHRDRAPWIAVSLQIEIEPLGDLAKAQPQAESLAKIVQASLVQNVFKDSKS